MKTALALIGTSIIHNFDIKHYILRNVEARAGFLSTLLYLEDSEKDILFNLERFEEGTKNIILGVEKKHFHTVAKTAATITEDTLINRGDYLIPKNALTRGPKNYAFTYKDIQISVFCVEKNTVIDLDASLFGFNEKFYITGLDLESAKLFITPLAESFEFDIYLSEITEGFNQCEITGFKKTHIDEFLLSVKTLLGDKIIITENIFTYLIGRLKEKNLKITFAESCTGGAIAYEFVKIPGCSDVLEGSVITYANRIKSAWLKVDKAIFETRGAVSEECVFGMLDGVLQTSGADIAVAVSGVAGPEGGTISKPVGTVYVGIGLKDGSKDVQRLLLKGDREYIQKQTVMTAAYLLSQVL